jgi:hypothetical protein
MDWGMRPSAKELATGANVRECLALWEQVAIEEVDAFLVRLQG